jgi:hypothetical protein
MIREPQLPVLNMHRAGFKRYHMDRSLLSAININIVIDLVARKTKDD